MDAGTRIFLFAALALFAAEPALAAVTCAPLQRGSLDGDRLGRERGYPGHVIYRHTRARPLRFYPGTAATDTEWRMACHGEEGDAVTEDDYVAARDAAGADAIVAADDLADDLGFVFDLAGVPVNFNLSQFRATDAFSVRAAYPRGPLVFLGDVRLGGPSNGGIDVGVSETLRDDLFVDSYADIHMTGGRRGLQVVSTDTDTDKIVRARNLGTIVTEGAGRDRGTWLQTGRGVYARSDGGDATSSNGSGLLGAVSPSLARVTTRGDGADGVYSRVNGAHTALALNSGVINTHGDAAYFQEDEYISAGLVAVTRGGLARASNGGTIRTGGVLAWGMRAHDQGDEAGRAEATNMREVVTTGAGAIGMRVRSDSGSARGTNSLGISGPLIVTRGEPWVDPNGFTRYAHGMWVYAPSGTAEAENGTFAVIETHGAGAVGMGVRSDGAALGRNGGTIVTRGRSHEESDSDRGHSHAMAIQSDSGDARAANGSNADIETHGPFARGMAVSSLGSGTARAFNNGDITTHSSFSIAREVLLLGDRHEWAGDRSGASGITAWSESGDAAVEHRGRVTVHGNGGSGIYAGIGGSGTASVTMAGGRVDAGGIGVLIEAPEGVAEATFSGGSRFPSHAYVDAGTALLIRSRSSNVTVEDSVIRGLVVFSGGRGDHKLTLGRSASVDGPIIYAAPPGAPHRPAPPWWGDRWWSDDDRHQVCLLTNPPRCGGRIILDPIGPHSSIEVPMVLGVTDLNKRGAGTARLSHMLFSGSRMVLEEGGLELRGRVDLGAEGTVTVHDAARLTILVGDVTENPDDHGSITAGGGVTFQQQEEGERTIYVQVAPEAAGKVAAIQTALEGGTVQPLRSGTRILKRVGDSEPTATTAKATTTTGDGETYEIGAFSESGTVSIVVPEGRRIGIAEEIEEAAPEAVASHRGNGPEEVAVGAAALLAFIFGSGLFDDAGTEEAALDECADTRRGWCTSVSLAGPGSPATVEERARLGGLETWTRLVGTDTAVPAAGVAGAAAESLSLGMDARLAGGFRLGVAVTPEMTSSKPWAPGVASGATLQGGRFALRAGWRDGPLFADAELSQGRYDARAALDNPAVGGALAGTFDLVQRQARATAGARIDLGGVRLTPALSPFSGTLRQDAWTAESAALTADVPGVSRRYSGVKASLGATSSEWLPGPGDLRWRPSLRFSTMSADTEGPSSLAMRQSDKAGVLSFASRGRMADLPRRVHGLATTATVAGSGDWRLRLGYAGMEVDGDVEHGAGLRLQARF